MKFGEYGGSLSADETGADFFEQLPCRLVHIDDDIMKVQNEDCLAEVMKNRMFGKGYEDKKPEQAHVQGKEKPQKNKAHRGRVKNRPETQSCEIQGVEKPGNRNIDNYESRLSPIFCLVFAESHDELNCSRQ